MPEYIVKDPLLFDGEKYVPGDPVEMTAKEAKELVDLGVLEASGAADSPPKVTKPNANDTIALVKEAKTIEELDVLAKDEERKTVVEAIDARRKEVAG